MKGSISVKASIFWLFYKSTLVTNLAISVLFAGLGYSSGFAVQIFAISFLVAGPIFVFLYNELAKNDEYYFYFNSGLSKSNLIVGAVIMKLIISIAILIFFA